MSKSNNFLDAENSILENKLRFVKNELEENLNEMFGDIQQDTTQQEKSRPYKIIKPDPGICVKAHRLSNNEKCFVNICKSDAIPPPEDITIDQLTVILTSETPSTYKIPMSITELRLTPDKSGNDAIICDVAIHPEFFKKVETLVIFRDFLITIIFEALDSKYNMQINRDTWIILKNRKCMGNLINHRIQNRDVKSVYESYQNPSKEDQKLIKLLDGDNNSLSKKSAALITEIKPNTSKQSICSASPTTYLPVRKSDVKSPIEIRKPQYKLFRTNHETPNCMIAEFYLPEVKAKNEITLDLGTDRIVLEARRTGYLLDSFFPLNINLYLSNAEFNTDSHILTVKMPVLVT